MFSILPFYTPTFACGTNQEENVHADVEVEGRKHIARVAVVPHEDLDWNNHGSVEEQRAAREEQNCHKRIASHCEARMYPGSWPRDQNENIQGT